jgi:hypothetical protein
MLSTCYSFPISINLEFFHQFFEKSSNMKFHENPSNGSRVFRSMQADRHDEANCKLFSILRTCQKLLWCIHHDAQYIFAVYSKRCSLEGKGEQTCSLIRSHRPLAILRGGESQGAAGLLTQCGSLEEGYSYSVATDLSENINRHNSCK